MGKRGRRNKPKSESIPETNGSNFKVHRVHSHHDEHEKLSPEIPDIFKIQEYKEEMGQALKQICCEYKNDFMKLRKRKIEQTIEFDYIPDYRLTVDKSFRRLLEQKIAYVYRYDTSNECYNVFVQNITKFVEDLKEQILKIDKRNVFPFIATIYDSFTTLKNVSKEISKIIHSMFLWQSCGSCVPFSCEPMTRLLFRDKIYRDTDITVEIEKFKRNNRGQQALLGNINKMENELANYSEILEDFDFDHLDLCSSSQSDSEDNPTPLQEMELDELVSFINGNDAKQPRKRRARRGKKAMEYKDDTHDEILWHDADVEEFKRKLEMTSPPRINRLKPNLSQEWLNGLRQRIQKTKS